MCYSRYFKYVILNWYYRYIKNVKRKSIFQSSVILSDIFPVIQIYSVNIHHRFSCWWWRLRYLQQWCQYIIIKTTLISRHQYRQWYIIIYQYNNIFYCNTKLIFVRYKGQLYNRKNYRRFHCWSYLQ